MKTSARIFFSMLDGEVARATDAIANRLFAAYHEVPWTPEQRTLLRPLVRRELDCEQPIHHEQVTRRRSWLLKIAAGDDLWMMQVAECQQVLVDEQSVTTAAGQLDLFCITNSPLTAVWCSQGAIREVSSPGEDSIPSLRSWRHALCTRGLPRRSWRAGIGITFLRT